ncbi:DNA-binding transcriptional LysR family regulator [Paucibacter oligotrophus]|uniref:DNA-binding transcriptional LysR family regulator n=1 Tax=Roseateles oligotrophus TaxID=1769250 RepID=A0A840LAT2_9BURK|nr:LysR substrate-binding domain-containing protein [Roseateles oligotrophus]MBB4843823.1 DNA-binding transcriptional LysR family regulator [Roseateles oligotrophus]
MDLHQLKVFDAVARAGSFAAAARELDMAPSMVTRAISALEASLGVRLMQRSTRRLALTEAGMAYHERVQKLLEDLQQANDEARASAGELRGKVRLTSSIAFGQAALLPLLPELHRLYPGLELDLLLCDEVLDLRAERVDLALRLGPSVDASLVGLPLAPVRYRVVASPAWLARHGAPGRPGELSRQACLRFDLPGFRSRWVFRQGAGEAETVAVKGWLSLSTAQAVQSAALQGLGPALLSDWLLAPDLAAGRLVDLFPQHEVSSGEAPTHVWLLYASRTHLPGRVRVLVDFLKARLLPRA